jgi:hypothetical protein
MRNINKTKRIGKIVLSLLITVTMIIGCSKGGDQGALSLDTDEFVYVPTYKTLSTEAYINANSLVLTQDMLYYLENHFEDGSVELVCILIRTHSKLKTLTKQDKNCLLGRPRS